MERHIGGKDMHANTRHATTGTMKFWITANEICKYIIAVFNLDFFYQ
jgi:hypothetical protein